LRLTDNGGGQIAPAKNGRQAASQRPAETVLMSDMMGQFADDGEPLGANAARCEIGCD
jgi:hypothetical protein